MKPIQKKNESGECPEGFSDDRFLQVMDLAQEGVYVTNEKGCLSFANNAFAELFHYNKKTEILGLNIAGTLYEKPDDRRSFLKTLDEKGSVSDYKIRMIRKDGSKVVVLARSHLLKDSSGKCVGVEGVLRDAVESENNPAKNENVDSEAKNQEKLEALTRDSLTGTLSYQYFVTRVDYEIRRATSFGRPLCLLMIDVDDFSAYNRKFGYPGGDMLLKKLGSLITENLRETDILCRQSQDQFFVVLPEAKQEDALGIAKQIKDAVQNCVFSKPVTCSIGVSRYVPGMTRQEILLRVNTGLCMAKQMGKNEACLYGL